jgi:DNA primase large subunit
LTDILTPQKNGGEVCRINNTLLPVDCPLNRDCSLSFNKKDNYCIDKNKEKKNSKNKYKYSDKTYIPPCIKLILNGTTEGNRNNTACILASFYNSANADYDQTINFMNEWNKKNSPNMTDGDVERVVDSIFNNEYKYGCTYISGLGYCNDIKNCKIANNKKG